jgi:hypothetical protein
LWLPAVTENDVSTACPGLKKKTPTQPRGEEETERERDTNLSLSSGPWHLLIEQESLVQGELEKTCHVLKVVRVGQLVSSTAEARKPFGIPLAGILLSPVGYEAWLEINGGGVSSSRLSPTKEFDNNKGKRLIKMSIAQSSSVGQSLYQVEYRVQMHAQGKENGEKEEEAEAMESRQYVGESPNEAWAKATCGEPITEVSERMSSFNGWRAFGLMTDRVQDALAMQLDMSHVENHKHLGPWERMLIVRRKRTDNSNNKVTRTTNNQPSRRLSEHLGSTYKPPVDIEPSDDNPRELPVQLKRKVHNTFHDRRPTCKIRRKSVKHLIGGHSYR